MIPEGIHPNLTEAEYRSDPAISQSELKAFGESATPLHFKATLAAGGKKQTPDMAFGTVCHAAVLTPERFAESYYLRPDEYEAEVRGKAVMKPWHCGADYCKDWLEKHADRPVMTKEDLARVGKIKARLEKLEPFASALRYGQKEVAFFKRDEETGLMLKMRCDLIAVDNNGKTVLFDMKKTQSGWATPKTFGQEVQHRGYNIQCSSYMHISGASQFLFVVFDDDNPFDAATIELTQVEMNRGYDKWRKLLLAYADCLKSGNWPGYPTGIQKSEPPKWLDTI